MAKSDLAATTAQAGGIAAMAWAWRMTALTGALALLATGGLAAWGSLADLAGYLLLFALSPLPLTFMVTFPLTFVAAAQGVFGKQQTDRFAFGGNVYFYYGWRYAFQGRLRSWGALTHAERFERDPERLAKNSSTPLHGRQAPYWPGTEDR